VGSLRSSLNWYAYILLGALWDVRSLSDVSEGRHSFFVGKAHSESWGHRAVLGKGAGAAQGGAWLAPGVADCVRRNARWIAFDFALCGPC
jgi:hypothetical protein